MDIEALEIFLDVMRQRNFTDVARTRNLAPSSISRTMTALENEIGIRLFQRSTRKLEPTEAGRVYFERVEPILDELLSARQVAADLIEEPKGILRVTASTVYGEMYIVPLLPELSEKHPLLSIELILIDAYMDLIEERIDVAVRLGTLQDSTYIAKQIKKLKFYVCASPEYIDQHGKPESPQEIKNHNCLLFPRTGHNLNWLFKNKAGEITEIPINGKCLVTNSRAIKQCAMAGMGLALLPDWLVCDDIQSGALIRLFDEFDVTATNYDGAIWLLYPSRDYTPVKARVFMDHLIEKI
ncbi:MAG TPA: LysR family transcriptional regulator [Gammaproteobacteria bacterium]|nr:LysR family transcriptional regulator [Gammaproteobacteria bacterium]